MISWDNFDFYYSTCFEQGEKRAIQIPNIHENLKRQVKGPGAAPPFKALLCKSSGRVNELKKELIGHTKCQLLIVHIVESVRFVFCDDQFGRIIFATFD